MRVESSEPTDTETGSPAQTATKTTINVLHDDSKRSRGVCLTLLCLRVGDLETTDGTLGFGPRHCQRVLSQLTEDDVGGGLRA